MKHVCRRCLTAFSSEQVLSVQIERCRTQKPGNIGFSWKEHIMFRDHHMKIHSDSEYMQISNVLINLQVLMMFYTNTFQFQQVLY